VEFVYILYICTVALTVSATVHMYIYNIYNCIYIFSVVYIYIYMCVCIEREIERERERE